MGKMLGIEDRLIADFLMSLGFSIGIVTKGYAVWDKNCTWTRKSSLVNAITLPITALVPYFLLNTYFSLFFASVKYCITIAKYVWRAPEEEDWLGRIEMTYSELLWLRLRQTKKQLTRYL